MRYSNHACELFTVRLPWLRIESLSWCSSRDVTFSFSLSFHDVLCVFVCTGQWVHVSSFAETHRMLIVVQRPGTHHLHQQRQLREQMQQQRGKNQHNGCKEHRTLIFNVSRLAYLFGYFTFCCVFYLLLIYFIVLFLLIFVDFSFHLALSR